MNRQLEGRELDPPAARPAAREHGALDEAVAGGVDAEVELVELAVAGLVAVAFDVGLEPGALLDGALDLVHRVVPAVRVDAAGGERAEDAEVVAEAERRLEVAVLVEDVGGAGAVLLPLVAPEADAVVGRARQRRPLGAQAAQQVAHLVEQKDMSAFLALVRARFDLSCGCDVPAAATSRRQCAGRVSARKAGGKG